MVAKRGFTTNADDVRAIRASSYAVNHVDGRVATAVMMAAQQHHAGIVRVLAERGADVNFADQRRATPLCLAVAGGSMRTSTRRTSNPRVCMSIHTAAKSYADTGSNACSQ